MRRYIVFLSLSVLVLSIALSSCGPKYAVMGTSIMAPKPGQTSTTPKKDDVFKGLGEPLKVAEATASSKSDHKEGKAGQGPGPEMTIDGMGGSRWSSAYEDNQWILYDLGAVKKINTVIIAWELAVPRKFRILVSKDKNNWTEVYSGGTRPGNKRFDFAATEAQYVKLDLIKRSTEWGFSLWEIYIYEAKE